MNGEPGRGRPTREELLAEYQDNSEFIWHQDKQYLVLWGAILYPLFSLGWFCYP